MHRLAFAEFPWRQQLDAIHNTVVLRDVVSRHQFRQVRLPEEVSSFLMDNFGSFSNAKSISDFLKGQRATASVETVQDDVRAMESAFAVAHAMSVSARPAHAHAMSGIELSRSTG